MGILWCEGQGVEVEAEYRVRLIIREVEDWSQERIDCLLRVRIGKNKTRT